MKDTVQITFERYYDANGNPTCACNFVTDEVCQFYRTKNFGTKNTCIFALHNQQLERRINSQGEIKLGTLIPLPNCILWKK